MAPDPKALAAQAQILRAQGRLSDAIGILREILIAAPASAAAEHNLAAAMGDAGRWGEAETHMRAAFSKGAAAPESWLVLARCLQARNAFDEAENAFLAALSRRPAFADAQLDLAQLRWMRTGDRACALADVDKALTHAADDAQLRLVKARVLENTGDEDQAFRLATTLARAAPDYLPALVYAAQRATRRGADDEARAYAERAALLAPNDNVTAATLISTHLGAGEVARAAALALTLVQRAPADQHAIALLATAWRMLGDPRYRALHDYDGFVRSSWLTPPPGWASLAHYVDDLRVALQRAHVAHTHPFNQSIRNGSQVPDVLSIADPAIAALPAALAPSISNYVERLGRGDDPLRRRNLGGYAFQGMWSIRMQSGGYHTDHVHPNGWISSACYLETPHETPDYEGWIRFGAPGIRTTPPLPAERFIEPKPGMLVLFPSYMWHGVAPYAAPATRMTFAFDLEPSDSRL